MREDKKYARYEQQLASLLGIKPNGLPTVSEDDRSREAEAVLAYCKDPTKFNVYTCVKCGGDFAVNRINHRFCSVQCGYKDLEEMGIPFNPLRRPEDAWNWHGRNSEPLKLGPEALKAVLAAGFPLPGDAQTLENAG